MMLYLGIIQIDIKIFMRGSKLKIWKKTIITTHNTTTQSLPTSRLLDVSFRVDGGEMVGDPHTTASQQHYHIQHKIQKQNSEKNI